jgi:hypothetical protein
MPDSGAGLECGPCSSSYRDPRPGPGTGPCRPAATSRESPTVSNVDLSWTDNRPLPGLVARTPSVSKMSPGLRSIRVDARRPASTAPGTGNRWERRLWLRKACAAARLCLHSPAVSSPGRPTLHGSVVAGHLFDLQQTPAARLGVKREDFRTLAPLDAELGDLGAPPLPGEGPPDDLDS